MSKLSGITLTTEQESFLAGGPVNMTERQAEKFLTEANIPLVKDLKTACEILGKIDATACSMSWPTIRERFQACVNYLQLEIEEINTNTSPGGK